jgi:hypothetical protein
MSDIIPVKQIVSRIYEIRDRKVMLDRDLAELYGVETRVLNQSVKRNADRFPEDFMFQLSKGELDDWRSRFVTADSSDVMGLRRRPHAFTEHGVLMLSNILKSERAAKASIQIIRVFIRMRQMLQTDRGLAQKVSRMERRQDEESKAIWQAIRRIEKELLK